MTDTVSKEIRSWIMSKVRGKNTSPEIIVRQILHRTGFRFRLHAKDLPGRPDIVNRRRHIAVFVHGCFWHAHRGCRFATVPKTRTAFWKQKLETNAKRDLVAQRELRRGGWRILVVWQCELRKPQTLQLKIQRFLGIGNM